MKEEMKALESNQTWTLIPQTLDLNVLGCKWVYRLEQDKKGEITRHKTSPVVKGMRQINGVDVQDTFAPVIKPSTIRIVLSIAMSNGWDLR